MLQKERRQIPIGSASLERDRVHKWTSLICTVFLLSECLTGLPLIFGEEILDLTHKHVHAANVPADTPLASLDGILAAGRQMYPGLKVLFVGFDDEEPRVFLDLSEQYDPKPGEDHSLVFDAHTGKLLEEQNLPLNWVDYVFKLHTELFVGLPGKLFLGLMAMLFSRRKKTFEDELDELTKLDELSGMAA